MAEQHAADARDLALVAEPAVQPELAPPDLRVDRRELRVVRRATIVRVAGTARAEVGEGAPDWGAGWKGAHNRAGALSFPRSSNAAGTSKRSSSQRAAAATPSSGSRRHSSSGHNESSSGDTPQQQQQPRQQRQDAAAARASSR